MTESQKATFEAVALLRAHASLLITIIDAGTVDQMEDQLARVKEAMDRVSTVCRAE